jgi:oxygen-dependent protoporphyrinogen oxidase
VTDASRARVAIVGGGITGLAAAVWLEHDHGIRDVVVLEADDRPGGKIRTSVDRGHVLEWGPQGFLDNAPDTVELSGLAGLDGARLGAADDAAARFIVRERKLRPVPTSPAAFLRSDVLPLTGRARVLLEPLVRRRPSGDETVFEFARRRIGRAAAEVLIDAMVTGIFAGDSQQLSLAATFPRMAAMEAEHGSLTKALIDRVRQARAEGRSSGGPAGPGGTLTSFRLGFEQLPQAIARTLGDRLRLAAPVERIECTADGFTLHGKSGTVAAEELLLTIPAQSAARLLEHLAPAAVDPLLGIPSVPIAVVMTSYSKPDAFPGPVNGFGFLVPRTEDLGVLGTLFCHAIFPRHAPDGTLLLRTLIGGARNPDAVDADDATLTAATRRALSAVLGADPDPDRSWIVRWAEGISQYTVGHLDRIAAAESAAAAAGIELAGSPYRGVSVNDCIRQARTAAARIAARCGAGGSEI